MSESPPTPVQFAAHERVDAFGFTAETFITEVLGLPWAFISDESTLADFSGIGLPEEDDEHEDEDVDAPAADAEARHERWAGRIVDRICTRYRIDRFPVTIRLVDLFARIEGAAPLQ